MAVRAASSFFLPSGKRTEGKTVGNRFSNLEPTASDSTDSLKLEGGKLHNVLLPQTRLAAGAVVVDVE